MSFSVAVLFDGTITKHINQNPNNGTPYRRPPLKFEASLHKKLRVPALCFEQFKETWRTTTPIRRRPGPTNKQHPKGQQNWMRRDREAPLQHLNWATFCNDITSCSLKCLAVHCGSCCGGNGFHRTRLWLLNACLAIF